MILAIPEVPHRGTFQRALDLVFPPRCTGCRRPGDWICRTCWTKMPWLPPRQCAHCLCELQSGRLCPQCLSRSLGSADLRPVNPYAVVRHEGIARQTVHELKYTEHRNIATVIGPLMAAEVASLVDPLVVPVPLHWSRKRERGFNQSELLAREIVRANGWRPDSRRLVRHRRTKHQIDLTPAQRQTNVAGAFKWEGERTSETILLVDDVFTTGSTLNACAGVLAASGAHTIHAVVFACAPAPQSLDQDETREPDHDG